MPYNPDLPCSFNGCESKRMYGRGWCLTHWKINKKICSVPFCENAVYSIDRCRRHKVENVLETGEKVSAKLCQLDFCDRPFYAKGLCRPHYGRHMNGASLESPITSYNEPGKFFPGKHGYMTRVRLGEDGKRHTELEHRWVMENFLGIKLTPRENVHPINGDKSDNRLENLELWSTSQPSGQRVLDKLDWAREIIARYEPQEEQLREAAKRDGNNASKSPDPGAAGRGSISLQ